jgi:uncharacterized membrane protein YdjX (TVP38/TMEM64 family)
VGFCFYIKEILVLLQTAANILPVPGEFISIILMEIYGPIWGGVYSWIGGLAGAVAAIQREKFRI